MQFSDGIGVAEYESSILAGEFPAEVIELLQVSLYGYGCVEEHREYGLCGAGIVDDLPCKEQILVVVGEVILLLDLCVPLEEEDESIDVGFYLGYEVIVFETVDFLDLDSRGAYLLNQFGKHPGIGLDRAPLIEHCKI
jgi:hypothetical protein